MFPSFTLQVDLLYWLVASRLGTSFSVLKTVRNYFEHYAICNLKKIIYLHTTNSLDTKQWILIIKTYLAQILKIM